MAEEDLLEKAPVERAETGGPSSPAPHDLERRRAVIASRKLLAAGQWRDAEVAAEAVLSDDPENAQAYDVLYLSVLESDTPERFVDVVNRAVEHASSEPRFKRLGQSLFGIPDHDALALVDRVTTRWPDSARAAKLRERMSGGRYDASNDKDRLSATSHISLKLATIGRVPEALDFIDRSLTTQDAKAQDQLLRIRTIVGTVPATDERTRPLISDHGAEVTCSEATDTGDVVLFFAGLGQDAVLPFELFDAFFARAGMSSIFVRDKSRSLGLGGIRSLGRSRKATQQALRSKLDTLGCRRLLVFGKSAGGFSAIQYGCEMGADRVLAFSPPTEVTTEFMLANDDSRGKVLVRRLAKSFSEEERSLSRLLDTREQSCRIDIHFGADMPVDRAHAQHLSDLPGVSLHPVPGCSKHRSVLDVLVENTFAGLLTW